MKRHLLIFMLMAAVPASLFQPVYASVPKDTLRILAIGNSFSVDAVNQNFGEIAAASGRHVIVGNLFIAGCSLERHCKSLNDSLADYTYYKRIDGGALREFKKTTMFTGIQDEPWDIVTFQQSSPLSGQKESYEPYLGELVSYIKSAVPTAKRLMWHQTWAYHKYSTRAVMYSSYGSSAQMYDAICTASKYPCEAYGMEIIPCGTAIHNLCSSFDRDNCYRDGFHLSYTSGRFTAACTWFEAIFDEKVTSNPYAPAGLASYRADVCRNAADKAVSSPFVPADMAKMGFEVKKANYDEALVPAYTLPDALILNDGTPVKDKKVWMQKRRPELIELFTGQMFGKAPAPSEEMSFEVMKTRSDALGGKATFKEVRIHLTRDRYAYIDLLVITPNRVGTTGKKGTCPIFLGINFNGNFTVAGDDWISMPDKETLKWKYGIMEGKERGESSGKWPLEQIIDAGYGVATFYRGDVAPDFDNAHFLGAFSFMNKGRWRVPASDEWGNIAAWAWGLSRAMDYLEADPDLDAEKVAVIGHSRLGKAALWAGATDQRFAMVISNESGCCGAALSRRCVGETVEAINKHFPHWFCDNFKKYNGREDTLPFDQHELLALIAPRPLYVASAEGDRWSDPIGEGLSLKEAEKVYSLFGKVRTGRHIRQGRHDITPEDWGYYLAFADKWLK